MPTPLISAAMIMRDESRHLPACLESIREIVDEIVIVDTGSIDDSVQIAESFGARVAHHPWDGSFAEPRNVGLDLATGEWILYIDADERLRPVEPGPIRAMLRAAPELAFRLQLTPFRGSTPYWEYRLWRSDPRIRFAGRMHEKVAGVLGEISAAEGRRIGEAPLSLDHVGYEGDQTHKHRRNLPMLRARLAENPADTYNWRHLSKVLAELGEDVAAREALDRAAVEATAAPHYIGAITFTDIIQQRAADGLDVGELIDTAIGLYPESIGLAWHRAVHEIRSERYEEALRELDRFDVDPDLPVEDTIAYRRDLFLVDAWDARGLCLFRLGRYAGAAAAYREAEVNAPGDLGRRVRRQLAEHLAARAGSPPEPARTQPDRWRAREIIRGITLDVAGVPIRVSATDAMRATAIHRLLGAAVPTTRDPVAELRFSRHRPGPPSREADDTFGVSRVWHDAVFRADVDGRVGARVDGAYAEVGGAETSLDGALHAIGPFILARLLAPHGRYLLHAAAIRDDRGAILLLGGSGAGKSTLVYGALNAGWEVLSDDLVVVVGTPTGPEMTGLPRRMLVPEHATADDPRVPWRDTDRRGRVQVEFDGWHAGSTPIAAVGIVDHGSAAHPTIDVVDRPSLLGLTVASLLSRNAPDITAFVPTAIAIGDRPNFVVRHGRRQQTRAADSVSAVARWVTDVQLGGGGTGEFAGRSPNSESSRAAQAG